MNPPEPPVDPWVIWWPRIRDATLFFVGLAGIVYETVWEHIDRPELLILFGAMVGLPGVVRADAARRLNQGNGQ